MEVGEGSHVHRLRILLCYPAAEAYVAVWSKGEQVVKHKNKDSGQPLEAVDATDSFGALRCRHGRYSSVRLRKRQAFFGTPLSQVCKNRAHPLTEGPHWAVPLDGDIVKKQNCHNLQKSS